jgi:hypothetical protein
MQVDKGLRDEGGSEVWRGECEWYVLSVVVVLVEVGDGVFLVLDNDCDCDELRCQTVFCF